jgi:hypothetical protein
MNRPERFGGIPIRRVSEVATDWGMCMAIYGPPGVGKTTFAAGAAQSALGSPVLFLDAEGGIRSISHDQTIEVIEVHDWATLIKFNQELMKTPPDQIPWKTIVLDNMSEFQAVSLRRIVAGNEMAQIQDWGRCTQDMLLLTRFYRDLARVKGVSVILIAWETPDKDESTGIVKRDVGFTPSLARQFPGIVDIVGYLEVMNDPPKYTRCLSFAPSPRTAAKFRRSRNENAMEIPYMIWYGADDNPMADLLATLKGGAKWPKQKYLKPAKGS